MNTDIEKKIREIFGNFVKDKEIAGEMGIDRPLEGLGINSVDFIKILVMVENEFDIEFSDDDLTGETFITINDFINCVESLL